MWQLIAIISGASVTLLMGIANVAYSMSLATGETLGIPNSYLFAILGGSLDLLMVAAPFAFHNANPVRRVILAVIFTIASLYSVHAMHGYLKTQTTSVTINETYHRELDLRLKEKRPDFKAIEQLRSQIKPASLPVQGFEWLLAVSLWFINATIWYAFFGGHLTTTLKQTMERTVHAATGNRHGEATKDITRRRTASNRLI